LSARLIDGARIARTLQARLREQLQSRWIPTGAVPGLTVMLVGENPASKIYVGRKIKACGEVGIHSQLIALPDSVSEQRVLEEIERLNADPQVNGILVQLPLPKQISVAKVQHAIRPDKDVDGFHPQNIGALVTGEPSLQPCTPLGCLKLLDEEGVAIEGRRAVVVGRSNIVGKPMALMLLQRSATVTICHSKTSDLGAVTREADILVAAVGIARLIKAPMVKRGAAVIDVGMNRLADGTLCGDVDFPAVREVAGSITPVPGGVGPMTIAMLLHNTVLAASRLHGKAAP
jgi:methylenetetrahydrofolate dehydrogenase (NADP+) / methenyltetrahydrofolate cyclohydrolase